MKKITIKQVNAYANNNHGYNHFPENKESDRFVVDYCLPHISGKASLGLSGIGIFKDEAHFKEWASYDEVNIEHRLFYVQYYKLV